MGQLPRGIGLDRLRFDGEKLVDLASLSQFWVRPFGSNSFEFHVAEVEGSQLVNMAYHEKDRLRYDGQTITLLTQEGIESEQQVQLANRLEFQSLKSNMKEFIIDLSYAEVLAHIDNVFGALTDTQKASLKKLYCTVLYLAKRQLT